MGYKHTVYITRDKAIERVKARAHLFRCVEAGVTHAREITDGEFNEQGDLPFTLEEFIRCLYLPDYGNLDQYDSAYIEYFLDLPWFRFSYFENYLIDDERATASGGWRTG